MAAPVIKPKDGRTHSARYKVVLTLYRTHPMPVNELTFYGLGEALVKEGLLPDNPEEVIVEFRQVRNTSGWDKTHVRIVQL